MISFMFAPISVLLYLYLVLNSYRLIQKNNIGTVIKDELRLKLWPFNKDIKIRKFKHD